VGGQRTYEADLNRALRADALLRGAVVTFGAAYADVYVAAAVSCRTTRAQALWEATRNDFNVLSPFAE